MSQLIWIAKIWTTHMTIKSVNNIKLLTKTSMQMVHAIERNMHPPPTNSLPLITLPNKISLVILVIQLKTPFLN